MVFQLESSNKLLDLGLVSTNDFFAETCKMAH